jgi:hypothetical protein
MKQNGFLLTNIAGLYDAGEDLDSLFSAATVYGAISVPDVRSAATRYLDDKNYVEVKLVPQK